VQRGVQPSQQAWMSLTLPQVESRIYALYATRPDILVQLEYGGVAPVRNNFCCADSCHSQGNVQYRYATEWLTKAFVAESYQKCVCMRWTTFTFTTEVGAFWVTDKEYCKSIIIGRQFLNTTFCVRVNWMRVGQK